MRSPSVVRCLSARTTAVSAAVGLASIVASCTSTLEPASGDPAVDLRNRDPRIRIQATRAVVDAGRRELIPDLVDALEDRDGSVRLFSAVALRKLSGEDFGYLSHGTLTERRAAVARWRVWANKAGLSATGPGQEWPPKNGGGPR